MSQFWPEDLKSNLPLPPIGILRRAAQELGALTQGAIEAEINSHQGNGDWLTHNLNLFVPSLGFRYPLLAVEHDTALYPSAISVHTFGDDGPHMFAQDHVELEARLKDVFSDRDVQRIVKALLAQTQALSA
jgi:hypothetical protein